MLLLACLLLHILIAAPLDWFDVDAIPVLLSTIFKSLNQSDFQSGDKVEGAVERPSLCGRVSLGVDL